MKNNLYSFLSLGIVFTFFGCTDLSTVKTRSEEKHPESELEQNNGETQTEEAATHEKVHLNELKNIAGILPYIDKNTLVVLDIDGTVLWAPGHTLPHPDVSEVSLAEGQATLTMWQELIKLTSNGSDEPGAKFIFLTARSPEEDAKKHLELAGLSNYRSEWIDGKIDPTSKYKAGILYASHQNKGTLLNEFLTNAKKVYPGLNKIIFADDIKENATNVFEAIKDRDDINSAYIFWYRGNIHPAGQMALQLINEPAPWLGSLMAAALSQHSIEKSRT